MSNSSVLIIGGGGREHAIAWKISQSPKIGNIYASPGSPGIQQVAKATCVPEINIKDFQAISTFCKAKNVNLVIVGPEEPLANGIADTLTSNGIPVFGPGRVGARIESDKDWAKLFMDKHGIPTAKWRSFRDATEAKNFIKSAAFPALVVKASGLAAGKGVVVAADKTEACNAVDEILTQKKFGGAGDVVVIEELLQGEEVSVLAFCDGNTVKAMLPSQDHKRIFNGDLGPNTGGMGAYCPCPLLNSQELKYVEEHVLQRALDGFKKENIKFIGILYAGLMLTKTGPKVLEFNCRFGDPETEVILPLLDSDLFDIMTACCNGSLSKQKLKWKADLHAVGVVMASRGYPETSSKGQVISGIQEINERPNHVVFHCGIAQSGSNLVTNGGRVLIAVSMAPQLTRATVQATDSCKIIKFDGAQWRTDIAHKGIATAILSCGKLTYKASGVDITAGNALVEHIKPAAKSTNRTGVMGSLGGFGGLFDTKIAGYKDPILVSGTDGVGTKLKIAHKVGIHDTIGIDLVAMCVNDILAHGAEPLFFLDYFACGALDVDVAKKVVTGIAEGCKQSNCGLIGGETAEMPDMYPPGDYDLAGFAVGAVERAQLMPHIETIKEGDCIIGLPSSGVHSNGFSLVRKVMNVAGVDYKDRAPFSPTGRSFGAELLTPTKIYVKTVIPALKTGKVKAFAHITGGGLVENIPRVLPKNLGVELDADKWQIPAVFSWLATAGSISQSELLRTFNCGIGAILVVPKDAETEIRKIVESDGAVVIGHVTKNTGAEQVLVRNFANALEPLMRAHVPGVVRHLSSRKRVGVLISGTGTNLQALIDSTITTNLGAEISLVISNKPGVEGLKKAEKAGIATKIIPHGAFPSREDFDRALHQALEGAHIEIVCLAGFMRILSAEFTRKWKGKLINIHPALLPLFKGTHAQRQALEAGVRVTGCTVHFVDETMDGGHIIHQETVPVEVFDSEESLSERIRAAEHRAFPKALEWVAKGMVQLSEENKLVWRF